MDLARGLDHALRRPRSALDGARGGLSAARRRAGRTSARTLAAARDGDGDRAAAAPRRTAVGALLGSRRPLRQGPRRRRASRAAAHARSAQPPRRRAPAVGLGRAHAAVRRGPAAPLRPRVDPLRRPAGTRALSRLTRRLPGRLWTAPGRSVSVAPWVLLQALGVPRQAPQPL